MVNKARVVGRNFSLFSMVRGTDFNSCLNLKITGSSWQTTATSSRQRQTKDKMLNLSVNEGVRRCQFC